MNQAQLRGIRESAKALGYGESPAPTPTLERCVGAWLTAKAYAEAMDKIDEEISNSVLRESAYHRSPEWCDRWFDGDTPPRIIDRKDAWTMPQTDHDSYLSAKRDEWEKRGFVCFQNGDRHCSYRCPALSARTAFLLAGRAVVFAVIPIIGESEEFAEKLKHDSRRWQQFIDLAVRWVVGKGKEIR